MNPEHDLNELYDRELGRLPMMQAPRTLAPRVMAAVRAKAMAAEAPWWLQSWAQWPMYARAALFIVAALIASIFFSGSAVLDDQVRSYTIPDTFSHFFSDLGIFGLLWQKIGQPLFLTRIAVCVAMYFVCIGLITAMYRVVTRETHP
jgi:hypothetical protein